MIHAFTHTNREVGTLIAYDYERNVVYNLGTANQRRADKVVGYGDAKTLTETFPGIAVHNHGKAGICLIGKCPVSTVQELSGIFKAFLRKDKRNV